jgi:SOS-response transcriptional repressor LexA
VRPVSPTDRQREVLRIVRSAYAVLGEPPSLRSISRRLGISHRATQEHLDALYRKGWLRAPCPGGVHCLHEGTDGELTDEHSEG